MRALSSTIFCRLADRLLHGRAAFPLNYVRHVPEESERVGRASISNENHLCSSSLSNSCASFGTCASSSNFSLSPALKARRDICLEHNYKKLQTFLANAGLTNYKLDMANLIRGNRITIIRLLQWMQERYFDCAESFATSRKFSAAGFLGGWAYDSEMPYDSAGRKAIIKPIRIYQAHGQGRYAGTQRTERAKDRESNDDREIILGEKTREEVKENPERMQEVEVNNDDSEELLLSFQFGISKVDRVKIMRNLGRTVFDELENLFRSYWAHRLGVSDGLLEVLGHRLE